MPDEIVNDQQVETSDTTQTEQPAEQPAARPEKPAFDRSALEAKLNKQLGSVFTDQDTVEEEQTAEQPAGEQQEQTTADDAQDEQVEKTEEQEAQGAAAQPPKTKTDAPTLPAAYIRTLKAYEWTDEEIASGLKQNGMKFVETAAKLHNNRNKEVSQWAEAGRQARTAQQQNQPAAVGLPTQPLKPVDAAALKEHYGDDKLIDAVFGPVNAVIAQINAVLPIVQQTQQRGQVAEQETLIRQIDGFFGGKELEPYKEIYGDVNSIGSNKPQQESRNKVLEYADALMAGASLQGRSLTLGEAMQMAHDSFSSGYKVQAVRTTIKNELKQRNKGITLRPTNRASAAPAPKTRSSLESKVLAGLQKAFA